MLKVFSPAEMNEAFANAFNRRDPDALLVSYEDGAVLCMGPGKLFAGDDGKVLAAGSSAEVLRRQAEGSWRYVLDHATAIG